MRRTRQSSGGQRYGVLAGWVCPAKAGANARAHLADEWVEVAIAKFKIGKKDKTESKAEVGKALPSRGKRRAAFGG